MIWDFKLIKWTVIEWWNNYCTRLRKWFEPRSSIPWLKKIIWVIGVLRRTVVSNSPSQDSYHPDDLFQSRCTRLLQNIVICQSKALVNKNFWSARHWQITIFCSTFLNNFQVMLILQSSKHLLISLTLAFNIPSAWQSLEHGLSSQKW